MQIPFQIKGETIYLVADDSNYALAKVNERVRDGKAVTELESYKFFANIGQALNKITDLKVKRSEAQTLQELRQAIEAAQEEVMSVWNASAEAR